jgi:hypothetical protein
MIAPAAVRQVEICSSGWIVGLTDWGANVESNQVARNGSNAEDA